MKSLSKVIQKILIGAALIAPMAVYASTAANTVITNTVTVFYQDTTGVKNYNAETSVQFSVTLLAAAPTIVVDPIAQSTSETTVVTINYIVTGNANGEDAYDFAVGPINPASANLSAATTPGYTLATGSGGVFAGPGTLTLGGTTLAAPLATNATVLTVPWDGVVGGTAVNGLTAGDSIVLDNTAYLIGSVDNSAADVLTNNYATITLDTAYLGAALPVGTIIGEQAVITLTFTSGSLSGSVSSENYTIEPVVTYSSLTVTADTATVTVRRPSLAITKYVRNATTAVTGSGVFTVVSPSGSENYYTSGVSGKPGDVMEYLIHIDNTLGAGSSVAQNIIVADAVPEFTTLDTTSVYLVAATTAAVTASHTWNNIAVGTASSAAEVLANVLCVYAGSGGDNTGTTSVGGCEGTGGTLLGADTTAERSLVVFKVAID